MLSRSFPDLIDAKFTNYTNFSNDKSGIYLYNILTKLFDKLDIVEEVEHLKLTLRMVEKNCIKM